MLELQKIRAFLNRPGIEGPQQLRGYIPCRRKSDGRGRNYIGKDGTNPGEIPWPSTGDPKGYTAMGISGVTIATGVDLGQTDEAVLTRNGLSSVFSGFLIPYLGLRKEKALQKLHAFPLSISREMADALDNAILSIHTRNIPARYNHDNPDTLFQDLPWQAQAAIFSLLFQRGTGAAGREPDIWRAFVRGDFAAASRMLCTTSRWTGAQEQYLRRRKLEGELLWEIL
jgi:hypothetical protein